MFSFYKKLGIYQTKVKPGAAPQTPMLLNKGTGCSSSSHAFMAPHQEETATIGATPFSYLRASAWLLEDMLLVVDNNLFMI